MTNTHEIAVNAQTEAATAHVLIAKQEEVLSDHKKEFKSLWNITRQHDVMLEKHNTVMEGIGKSVDKLSNSILSNSNATVSNTATLRDFKTMAKTAVVMGGAFIGFVVFVGSKLMHWW